MPQKYRLLGRRLRVQRGPGNEDLVVERPVRDTNTKTGTGYVFLDSDENPTLVEFDDLCQVDIPSLIQIGAIVEYVAPSAVPQNLSARKGGSGGSVDSGG
jgi:hypothetical protein